MQIQNVEKDEKNNLDFPLSFQRDILYPHLRMQCFSFTGDI